MNNLITKTVHIPVMLGEVLDIFKTFGCTKLLDTTFGGGGHSSAILEQIENSRVWALDKDKAAFGRCSELAKLYPSRLFPFHTSFGNIKKIFENPDVFDGILFDLGVSSDQLAEAERGFSFHKDGPLDMRMDSSTEISAADIVNWYPETGLAKIFLEYGEEPRAKLFAHHICQVRKSGPFKTTKQLADLITLHSPPFNAKKRNHFRHPATRVFQALRIEVNNELEQLETGLSDAFNILMSNGILIVISFHALEDRIVKKFIRHKSPSLSLGPSPSQLQYPKFTETLANPRSRSAKLRFLCKP